MYEVAEQQLALVCRKTKQLGEALQRQIDGLKKLRADRLLAVEECDELRRLLQAAEARASLADAEHNEAERCLKRTAEEFAATQLLQKRYENTLAELDGRQRAIVRVAGAAAPQFASSWDENDGVPRSYRSDDLSAAASPSPPPHHHRPHCGPQRRVNITITDECTVVELELRRTFVVDVAYAAPSLLQRMQTEAGTDTFAATKALMPASMHDEELASAFRMEQVISDVLSGVNTVFLSFGPSGGGKTEVLYGTKAATLEYERLQQLFRGKRRSSSRGRFSSVEPSAASGRGDQEQTAGLLSLFVNGLFDSLVTQSVTHFNIRCSFAEIAMNQTVDLLQQSPSGGNSNRNNNGSRGSVLMKMSSVVADGAAAAAASSASSPASFSCGGAGEEVTSVKVETAEETMRVFFDGLERLGRWRRPAAAVATATSAFPTSSRGAEVGVTDSTDGGNNKHSSNGGNTHSAAIPHYGGVSHAIFTLSVESFNTKGHYRRAMASFVDLCGSPPQTATRGTEAAAAAATITRPLTLEAQWVEESLQAVCDAIAATSSVRRTLSRNVTNRSDAARAVTAFDRLPTSHTNRIARFLRPIFGGNAKAVLVCCVDALQHTKEQVLNSLSYAFFFKRIQHHVVPYDIPPELQQLNLQMNAFFPGIAGRDVDDDEEEEEDECDVYKKFSGGGNDDNVDASLSREEGGVTEFYRRL